MQTSAEIINETISKEYSIVRLCRDNLDDLVALHEAVYSRKPVPGYYNYKYDTAYTGLANVGFIAYNKEGLAIAYYGVIPCLVRHRDNTILAAQSADTMTHPQHRYKGMFVELSRMTFELCRQLDIRFIFGFPNQNSYHGAVNKLGWQMITQMVYFKIPVQTLPLESLAKKASFFKNIYNRYKKWVLQQYVIDQAGLPNSVEADGYAGVYRGEEYLEYKSYSWGKVIRLNSVKFWISDKPGLLIGDIEGLNEVNFNSAVLSLKSVARKLGVRQIQFHCCPDTSLCRLFEKHFSPAPSYPILYQDFGSAISPMKARFCFADIDIF